MTRNSTGWIAVCGCLLAVTIAVIGGRDVAPPQAQAASLSSQPNAVSPETTQACQAVVQRMVTIQQTILAEKQARQLIGVAPLDVIVPEEYQIDTSKCPADFRMPVLRFVAAEDSARIHAHMDKTGRKEEFLTAGVEVLTTHWFGVGRAAKSLNDFNQKISDEQKQDFANIQAAYLDLAQVAMKYGVK
jgi:hypothetical protein